MLVGGAFALAGDVVVQPNGASGGQQQPAGVYDIPCHRPIRHAKLRANSGHGARSLKW
jgi:hypothetical protein